ncbi:hypothetical protein CYD26_01285 [Pseudomonas sp. FFUP_PS_473]|nr:hypothetical protein CYD26_01285 [Pseudomonas sp. FFUP_PS_473]
MIDPRIIEQSDALLTLLNEASAKLREFCVKHDTAKDENREKAVELQRAVHKAHATWLKFVEQNHPNWGV